VVDEEPEHANVSLETSAKMGALETTNRWKTAMNRLVQHGNSGLSGAIVMQDAVAVYKAEPEFVTLGVKSELDVMGEMK